MKYNKRPSFLLILFLVLSISVLVACGGGGGGGSEDASLEPPSQGSGLEVLVETEDGLNIGVIKGETSSHRVLIFKDDENIAADIAIVTSNRWIELVETDGLPFLSIDASQDWDNITTPVKIIITNRDNGLSAQAQVLVSVLDSVLVASGRLDSRGGVVQKNGGAFGVRIPQGELMRSLGIEIWSALSLSGQTHLRINFDRDVSNDTATMSFFSNLNAFAPVLNAARSENAEPVLTESSAETSAATRIMPLDTMSAATAYPLTNIVQSFPGWFIGSTRISKFNKRIIDMAGLSGPCNSATTQTSCITVTYVPDAAVLSTTMSPPEPPSGEQNAYPVLFVHGYAMGGALGGGELYWADFPKLVNEIQERSGESYLPYEFRWRTNASFTLVADDLAAAIARIYGRHGEPVTIIAHSFGGLLTRTLVQGLADGHADFQSERIGRILTLGTPHSGVFDKITTVDSVQFPDGTVDSVQFPDGQDQGSFNFCGQISCYQAGESSVFSTYVLGVSKPGKQGGLVAALTSRPFPDALPMVVGIGLKREGGLPRFSAQFRYYDSGDGLITFEGQRYNPSLNREPLRSCESDFSERISEIVLGAFNSTGEYDLDAKPGSEVLNNAFGYAHSAPGVGKNTPNEEIELSQAYVSCDNAATCRHASFGLFRSMVEFPGDFCDVPRPNPVATLAGTRVTVTLHYPASGLVATVPYETLIDSGIEIPAGLIQEIETYSNRLIPVDIDIGARTIDLQYRASATADNTSSNGYVFDFEPGAPMIVGASLDPSSTFTANMVTVTFEARRVKINFPGIRVDSSSRILVNLQFQDGS